MTPSQMLAARLDYGRDVAQKAEALRLEAQVEVHRYEGAVGVLKQAFEVLKAKDNVLSDEAKATLHNVLDMSQAELIAARGRVQQGEKTLDMLQALFDADTAAAQQLIAEVDAPKKAKGRHPGASIKTKRLVKSAS